MSQRLALLRATAPSWFTRSDETGPELFGAARPPRTAWEDGGLDLRIEAIGASVRVSEAVPGSRLPRRCAERHIQADQTFCLGLRQLPVEGRADAEVWWAYLEQWLQLQSIAAQSGIWPPDNALDHGHAGAMQLEALELSEKLGLGDEYRSAHAGYASWLTDPAVKIVGKSGQPINGRSVCPHGCTQGAIRPQPKLWRKCTHRASIIKLINLERRRRVALDAYWAAERRAGAVCCGTMLSCPLQ